MPSDDDHTGASVWRDIAARPPAPEERALIGELIDGVDSAELTDQARAVRVIGECTCGCSSVRLRTPAPPLTDQAVARLAQDHPSTHFAISGTSQDPGLGRVQVTVHVINGSLGELEIYAGPGRTVDLRQLSRPDAVRLTD